MPNDNARIICSSAIPVQADVLIANGDVHFLDDWAFHCNIENKR